MSPVDPLHDLPFMIGGRTFRSRLMVGTGKYATNADMIATIVPPARRW